MNAHNIMLPLLYTSIVYAFLLFMQEVERWARLGTKTKESTLQS